MFISTSLQEYLKLNVNENLKLEIIINLLRKILPKNIYIKY